MLALALTNNSLNIFTILYHAYWTGVKNAIMLVDYTNQRCGETIRTALIQANHARLRPILMTTIAWFGVPNCIGIGSWSRMEKRFGLSIGGLISSLFLTLIIVPVIYEIMEKLVAKFSKGEK
jgi:HAE1 family hydrophobic/amphiphilic exporter-1